MVESTASMREQEVVNMRSYSRSSNDSTRSLNLEKAFNNQFSHQESDALASFMVLSQCFNESQET